MVTYLTIQLNSALEKEEAEIAVDILGDTWEDRYGSIPPKHMPEVKTDVLLVPDNKIVAGALIGCFEDEIDMADHNLYSYRHSISPSGNAKALTDQITRLSARKSVNQKFVKAIQSKLGGKK